jgi:hypothetical protein
MWSLIVSGISYILNWVFRVSVIKWIAFTALSLVLGVFVAALKSQLEASALGGFDGLLGGLPNDVLYFMSVLRLDYGLPVLLAAYVLKFGIRRLPVIG